MPKTYKSLISLFCFILWWNSASAINEQYGFADALFHQKDYMRAASEYERSSFLSQSLEEKEYGFIMASESYYYAKQYQKSLEVLEKRFLQKNSPYYKRSIWLKVFNFHHMKNFSANTKLINNNKENFKGSFFSIMYPDLMNPVQWENQKSIESWKQKAAHISFEENSFTNLPYNKNDFLVEIENIYEKQKLYSYKKPWVGLALSVFPGGGQLYAGRTADAASSFLVVGLLFSVSAIAFHYNEPCTGAITAAIGGAFYAGNIYGGYRAVKIYNDSIFEQKRSLSAKLLPQYQSLLR